MTKREYVIEVTAHPLHTNQQKITYYLLGTLVIVMFSLMKSPAIVEM